MLAVLLHEPGADRVSALPVVPLVSTVNLAEVQARMVSNGLHEAVAWWHVETIGFQSVVFDERQARAAGSLVKITRPYGLSLGDRACIALAIERKAKILTADRVWEQIPLGVEVELIR
jgi:ribonuclease VapC